MHCSDPSETWFSLKLTGGRAGARGPGPRPSCPGLPPAVGRPWAGAPPSGSTAPPRPAPLGRRPPPWARRALDRPWRSGWEQAARPGPGPLPPAPAAAAEDSPGCSPGLHPSVAGAQLVNPEKANLGGRRMLRARRRTAQPWLPFLETQANLSSRGGVVTSWAERLHFSTSSAVLLRSERLGCMEPDLTRI